VPCLFGIVHTVFAMKALGNVMYTNATGYAVIVVAIYIVMQLLYFLLARKTYLSKVMRNA
jgi:putative ABC transport system permease protein